MEKTKENPLHFKFQLKHAIFGLICFSSAFLFGFTNNGIVLILSVLIYAISYHLIAHYCTYGTMRYLHYGPLWLLGDDDKFMGILYFLNPLMFGTLIGVQMYTPKNWFIFFSIVLNVIIFFYTYYTGMRRLHCKTVLKAIDLYEDILSMNYKYEEGQYVTFHLPEYVECDWMPERIYNELKQICERQMQVEIIGYDVIYNHDAGHIKQCAYEIKTTDGKIYHSILEKWLECQET